MKQNGVKDRGSQVVTYGPVPDFITCPECGHEIELWSGEYVTMCLICGHRVFRKEMTMH